MFFILSHLNCLAFFSELELHHFEKKWFIYQFFLLQLEWERRLFENIKCCEACHSEGLKAVSSLEQDDCSDYQEMKIQVQRVLSCCYYIHNVFSALE